MTLGSESASDVLSMLTEFGETITLRKVTEGAYDPSTGTTAAATTTDYAGVGQLMSYRDRDIDGSRILATDRKCLLAASGLGAAPTTDDRIVKGSDVYSIVSFATREVGGTLLYYVCQVRSA